MHVHMRVYIGVYVCVCIHIYVYISLYIYIYVIYLHIGKQRTAHNIHVKNHVAITLHESQKIYDAGYLIG